MQDPNATTSKKSCGRVAAYEIYGIVNSYTVECFLST